MLLNIVRMNVFSVCYVALWVNVFISIRGQRGNSTKGGILQYRSHLRSLQNESFIARCTRSFELTSAGTRDCEKRNPVDCEKARRCREKHFIALTSIDGLSERDSRQHLRKCRKLENICHDEVERKIDNCTKEFVDNKIAVCQERANNSFLKIVQNGSSCSEDEFSCRDGPACVFNEGICDGINHCLDRSDEEKASMADGRWCTRIGSRQRCLLPPESFCRGWNLCEGKIDNCLCETNAKYILDEDCFRCVSKPTDVLPISKLCDGVFDCPDFSDECMCSSKIRPTVCDKMKWETSGNSTSRQLYLMCNSSNREAKMNVSKICDKRNDCDNGEDEIGCGKEGVEPTETRRRKAGNFTCPDSSTPAIKCDGVAECKDFESEECACQSSRRPYYCDLANTLTDDRPICDKLNRNQLQLHHICNGRGDCNGTGDEQDCLARFYCTSEPLPNIPMEKRCDKQEDCDNGADEKNCFHFSCNDTGDTKFISEAAVCDGIKDCKDGSDECQDKCIKSAFADEKSMINIKLILALVWVIGVLAIIGCVAVIAKTSFDLVKAKTRKPGMKTSRHQIAIKVLILSLSVSDLMVAVYALAICIKALEFSRNYCLEDRAWRSSSTCSALGAILLIGSEQSVFTMMCIAVLRLHAVMRPFHQPNIRVLTVAILVCWMMSIALGTVPLMSRNEDYFVNSIMFKPNKIFKELHHSETRHMINWLTTHNGSILESNYGTSDWNKIKNLVKKVNPKITAEYEFGYYSSHTVCLPTFFPKQDLNKSWGYSLLLLTVNFVAFLFMLVVYILLYRHASDDIALQKCSALHQKRMKQNIKMQHKLTRIVLSDFLCWVPICIMGFLQLGGVNISKDAYLPAGLIIIPINSALNPFLYSDLPEMIIDKVKLAGRSLCPAKVIQEEPEVIQMKVRPHHLPGSSD